MINRLALFSMGTLALMMVSGCFSLGRQPVEKRFYSLEARIEAPDSAPSSPVPIMVKAFEIAPMYTTNSFVYRMEAFRFETDYYNEFIIPPQRMITEAFKQTLFDTKRFSLSSPGAPTAYRLSGKVIRLYGDFSNGKQPLAVMEIAIFLDPMGKDRKQHPVSKTFLRQLPISDLRASTLVSGWNTQLKGIIKEFMADLDGIRPGS
jgi:hypothetical protein